MKIDLRGEARRHAGLDRAAVQDLCGGVEDVEPEAADQTAHTGRADHRLSPDELDSPTDPPSGGPFFEYWPLNNVVRLPTLTIVGCVASTALLLSAQSPPFRDALPNESNPRSAIGLVRGRVLVDGTDIPIRKARVTLTREAGADIDPTYSNIEGRFEFSSVPPGRYTAAAWKTGYVETKFGAKSFWDRPVPVSVAAGAAVDDLQIGLARGAAISGRIVDAFGDPLFGRTVTVGRVAAAHGRRRFEQTDSA